MKSSVIAGILVRLLAAGRNRVVGGRSGGAARQTLEGDAREDEDAACDLEGVERLVEENQREEDREEGLQVAEERGTRGAHPVDRREPEDVREEERPDHRVTEPEPDLPPERELLVMDLRDRGERERRPADREDDGADA